MPGVRDHEPFVIEEFNGWWQRGDPESAPSDHFTESINVKYFSSGFETRDVITPFQFGSGSPTRRVKRIYHYVSAFGPSIIFLSLHPTNGGEIYHYAQGVLHGPVLTIAAMEDFGFVAINNRAYITPFATYTVGGQSYQLGLKNEFVYVYDGTGNPARRAGGLKPVDNPSTIMTADTVDPPTNGGAVGDYSAPPASTVAPAPEVTDPGFHLLAVVYETETGHLTSIGPASFVHIHFSPSGRSYIRARNIPIQPTPVPALEPKVVKRHLVATKTIPTDTFTGNQNDYQFFFIPATAGVLPNQGGTIPDNSTTVWTFAFFDSDLVDDASHLMDNFERIPSGVNLTTYHSRMVIVGEYGVDNLPGGIGNTDNTLLPADPAHPDNRSIVRISAPGEPEAISKVDGLLLVPRGGNPLTNAQEFRDVLYIFKSNRTFAYSDNFDVPASWQEEVLDQGMGAPVHGIATVFDSGGVNIDFLLIANWSGLMQFNGTYARPELSWKIEDFWNSIDRNSFNFIQIVNDTVSKKIWLTLPDPYFRILLHADYSDGLDAKNIIWTKWLYNIDISTIVLTQGISLNQTDALVMGSRLPIGPGGDTSGLYYNNNLFKHDVYLATTGTTAVKIPDPTIRTALLGE